MLRVADKDLVITVACKVGNLQNAGRNAGREQFPVPCAVIITGNDAGVLVLEDFCDVFFDGMEGL